MGGDVYRHPFPDYERTIPVGEHFRTRNRGEAVLLSIDLWRDRVALHFAYEMTTPRAERHQFQSYVSTPMLGDDGHPRRGPDFALSDDCGTLYECRGSGGGGSDDFGNGYALFIPGVPEAANLLIVTSSDLRRPLKVRLAP